jgi:glycosyltransferase involved in cell wall biosynthesis
MATDRLVIAYAGSLAFYDPATGAGTASRFGTYHVNNVDHSTRSAYYLFRGLQLLLKRRPQLASEIEIRFWGLIDKRTAAQADAMGLRELVHIEGYKPKAESLAALQRANVLFLPLESGKDGQRPLFIPGKFYEYLAARKPVLALAGESDCIDLLKQAGLGILADPFDENSVSSALERLLNNRGRLHTLIAPDEKVIASFSFDRIAEKIVAIFDELNQASA